MILKGYILVRHGIKLNKTQCPRTPDELRNMKKILHASAIGSIMHDILCTRQEVSLALSRTSKYQSNLGEKHWITVENILMYFKSTKGYLTVVLGVR